MRCALINCDVASLRAFLAAYQLCVSERSTFHLTMLPGISVPIEASTFCDLYGDIAGSATHFQKLAAWV